MTDIAEVARSLTKAQRDRIIAGIKHYQIDRTALGNALRRKGLASGFWSNLTPLGLAVRQYLQENPDA